MQETRYYCDVCLKEMPNLYYKTGVYCRQGFITKPAPNNVECCSVECVNRWSKDNLEVKEVKTEL